MADKIRVFVSHHHSPDEDKFTARLAADLEAAGADVWVDDQRITSDDFVKKINEGLAGWLWHALMMTLDALRFLVAAAFCLSAFLPFCLSVFPPSRLHTVSHHTVVVCRTAKP